MSSFSNPKKVMIPCRFSFLHCWEPDSVNGSEPKYSVSAIIPKSDTKTVNAIKAAIEVAKQESLPKWGGKIPPNLKLPLRDGDIDRPEDEAYAGCYFLNANSREKPQVVDKQVHPIADDMQAILQHLSDTAELDAEKEALQVEMGIVSELIRQAVGQNASAALDQAEYTRKYNSLTERFHKAADRVKEIDAECARRKGQRREIETFRDAVLANDQPVTVFSTELWNATIDRMTVKLDGSVKVTFRNGIEITV